MQRFTQIEETLEPSPRPTVHHPAKGRAWEGGMGGYGLTGKLPVAADGEEADARHKGGGGAHGKHGPRLGWTTVNKGTRGSEVSN